MVNDFQVLVKEIDACSLDFVKRSTNQEAHRLARATGSLPDSPYVSSLTPVCGYHGPGLGSPSQPAHRARFP